MTLVWTDGFDDRLMSVGKTPGFTNGTIVTTAGVMHGDHWSNQGDNFVDLGTNEDDHIIVGYNWIRGRTVDHEGLRLNSDSGATVHLVLQFIYVTGEMRVLRGSGGTVLGTSSTGIWTDDVMRHIEVDAILHDSAGQCKVYVDGLLAIDVTGADTKNAGTKTVFDRVVWRSGLNATHPRLDDAYIITNDGTAPTGRVGPSRIINLLPNGNGNSSTLTGSDGNSTDNYLLVDENPTNTSDYNGHATEGNKDTYTMGDLTSTNFTVFGARTHLYAAKSDAGSKFMRPVVRSGGTDFTGTSRSLSESYTVYSQSWGVDPNTSAQWTATNINAFEVGAEVRNS